MNAGNAVVAVVAEPKPEAKKFQYHKRPKSVLAARMRRYEEESKDEGDPMPFDPYSWWNIEEYRRIGAETLAHHRRKSHNIGEREKDLVSDTYLNSWDTTSGYYGARFVRTSDTKDETGIAIELQKFDVWQIGGLVLLLRLPYGVTLEVKHDQQGFAQISRNLPTPSE